MAKARSRKRKHALDSSSGSSDCEFPPLPPPLKQSELHGRHTLPWRPQLWRYIRRTAADYYDDGRARLENVDWTSARESLCLDVFFQKTPPQRNLMQSHQTVCVLALSSETGEEQVVYVSDYNLQRGIPNFVAFTIAKEASSFTKQRKVQRLWESAIAGLDRPYAPGEVKVGGWCTNASHALDGVCGRRVDSRGHLAPLAAFKHSYEAMVATNVFLNTVPTRQPFDGAQWARREKQIIKHAHRRDTSGGIGLHVLAGPSLQADGSIPSSSYSGHRIQVPTFLWSAYVKANGATQVGHFCRNGANDGPCACADHLQGADLGSRLGFELFPALQQSSEEKSNAGFGGLRTVTALMTLVILACGFWCLQNGGHVGHKKQTRAKNTSRRLGTQVPTCMQESPVMARPSQHANGVGSYGAEHDVRRGRSPHGYS